METIAEKLLPLRYAVPLLIVMVLIYALISEVTYRRTRDTLASGIVLTDAHIGAARLLQLLTDAETAQYGFLLTGDANYIQPLRDAQRQFYDRVGFLQFIAVIGPTGPADAGHISTIVDDKFFELDRTIELAQGGYRSEALALVQSDAGKKLMDELRESFKDKLAEAAQLQQLARSSIYDALLFSRLAVLALSGLLMAGLLLYFKKLLSAERDGAQRRQRLEQEVSEKTASLRTMASWLETVREDEKASLARELHDELGSLLTAAKLTLARMRHRLAKDPELLSHADSVGQRLNEGIALKRRIIEDLRPSTLSQLGLHVAIANLSDDASNQLGIRVRRDIAEIKAAPDAELALFRVVQEALTNVGKYSGATDVRVTLRHAGEALHLEVADNGQGFDVSSLQAGRHGLAGMRFRIESRGGTFTVVSAPGQGTRVTATLPLSQESASNTLKDDSLLQPL